MYAYTCTYQGQINENENLLDKLKQKYNKKNMSIKAFTLQTDTDVEIIFNDKSDSGTFFQSDNNYVLSSPDNQSGVAVDVKTMIFNTSCYIYRFVGAYSDV